MPIVAYVSLQDEQERAVWVEALNRELELLGAEAVQVVDFDELRAEQRSGVTLALAAGNAAARLRELPALRWVLSTWAGVAPLLRDLPSEIKVTRLVETELTRRMSEAVLTWTLALQRGVYDYAHQQAHSLWRALPYRAPQAYPVVVLGAGALGAAAATKLHAHGFPVTCIARRSRTLTGGIRVLAAAESLPEALRGAALLVNLLPDTAATRGLIDYPLLKSIGGQAPSLINFGRAAAIVDSDLIRALDEGVVHRAVLDVFAREPLPKDHPFWRHACVHVLPHVSATTSPETSSALLATHVLTYFSTPEALPYVDREAGY